MKDEYNDVILLTDEAFPAEDDDDAIILTDVVSLSEDDNGNPAILLTNEVYPEDDADNIILLTDDSTDPAEKILRPHDEATAFPVAEPPEDDIENLLIDPDELLKLSASAAEPADAPFFSLTEADSAASQEKFDDLENMFNEIIQNSQLDAPSATDTTPEAETTGTAQVETTQNAAEHRLSENLLTEAQITAAVERVMQNMVSGKIEDMLKPLLMEAIAREMDTMKSSLLAYLTAARIHRTD